MNRYFYHPHSLFTYYLEASSFIWDEGSLEKGFKRSRDNHSGHKLKEEFAKGNESLPWPINKLSTYFR